MKKLNILRLLSTIAIAAAGVFGIASSLERSNDKITPVTVEAGDITLDKDRTIIIAVWDNIDYTVWWSDTIAVHYWGTGIDKTVEVTKYGNNRLGYVTIPKGVSGCQVLRLGSNHQPFPIDGYPTQAIDNSYDGLNISDSNNVFTITGWTKVLFEATKDTGTGNSLIIVGSFNGWSTTNNYVALSWHDGNVWKGEIFLENGTYEYKAVHHVPGEGKYFWEFDPNHSATLSGGTETIKWSPIINYSS